MAAGLASPAFLAVAADRTLMMDGMSHGGGDDRD